MGMLDMATYTQLQAADAMRDAAKNPSGGAGLTAGIGAGMSIGQVMGEALKQGAAGGGLAGAGAAGAAAGAAMSDVMTVEDVAKILKASEEDVQALIASGELKAKKVGKGFRIGKAALQDYLGK
jgi:excisionase family DNA binding protein